MAEDFTRTAELSIVIPDRELRSARGELEDALAEIPVGTAAGGGGAGAGGAGDARERRRRRREFRWARQRTSDIETQTELLEQLVDDEDGGGGGGIVSTIIGEGSDVAGEGVGAGALSAAATALGGSATALGGSAAALTGAAASLAASDLLSGGSVEAEGPVAVEDTTLSVDDPSPLSVETPPDAGFADPPTVSVDRPEWDITVREPEWVPIEVVGRGGGRRAPVTRGTRTQDRSFGQRFREGLREVPIVGEPLAGFSENVTGRVFDLAPGVSRRDMGTQTGGRGRATNANVSASTGNVNVTVQTNVQSAVQDAMDELRREQNRQRQELRRDLERKLNDLQRQIGAVNTRPVR